MTPKQVVLDHGGSFQGVKSKAQFYMPAEMWDDARRLTDFSRAMLDIGSDYRVVREEGTWHLCRFVGKRKPYRTVWVNCRVVPHNVYPTIRLQIYPDGTIEMFEKGRKLGYTTTVGAIYTRAMMNDILQKAAAKARNKRKKRK